MVEISKTKTDYDGFNVKFLFGSVGMIQENVRSVVLDIRCWCLKFTKMDMHALLYCKNASLVWRLLDFHM